jgi:hypothetical protein
MNIDPPMINIKFVIDDQSDGDGSSQLRAEQFSDGHGMFDITGHMEWKSLSFRGRKAYTSSFGSLGVANVRWWWKLRLTPFGLIGDWYDDNERSIKYGKVWLWRMR